LDFSFFVREKSRLPYMTAFLKLIDTIFYSPTTVADDLITMSQKLTQKHNFHLFISDPKEGSVSSDLLNAAYLSKTAIIPVAIRNAKSVMKFGLNTITVSFCTPLHFEEYGPLDPKDTLGEITKRIENELKEG